MKKELLLIIIVVFVSACKSSDSNVLHSTQKTTTTPATHNSEIQNGWVQLSYDISESGAVENIKIIDSYPTGKFDNLAVEALNKWKYEPKVIDGVPVKQIDLKVQLDF